MDKIKSILFVCTGNSCRSVMAEGLMRKYLKELGKEHIRVSSAGVSAIAGFYPTDETVEVMKKEGVDVSAFKSKKISEDMIRNSDLILVMEKMHKDIVTNMVPEAVSKTHLLKEFMIDRQSKNYSENPNVPDPIGAPMNYYKISLEVIKDNVKRIARLI